MITLKAAQTGDFPAIERILEDLELGHASIRFDKFHVAVHDSEIVGVANAEDCGESIYVSAVGVIESWRGRGVARRLIEALPGAAEKELYLYTRIPEFFATLGFSPAEAPAEIPSREIYDCRACGGLHECLCMVRKPNGPSVS